MQTHLAAIALANRHSISQCTPSGSRAWPMSLPLPESTQTAPQPSATHMRPNLAFATYQTRSPLAPTYACMPTRLATKLISHGSSLHMPLTTHSLPSHVRGTSYLISRLLSCMLPTKHTHGNMHQKRATQSVVAT